MNEAGYNYRLVSSESEADAPVTARTRKQRKLKPVENGCMTSCPSTIVNALADVENAGKDTLSLVDAADPTEALNSRIAVLGDRDLWHALGTARQCVHTS